MLYEESYGYTRPAAPWLDNEVPYDDELYEAPYGAYEIETPFSEAPLPPYAAYGPLESYFPERDPVQQRMLVILGAVVFLVVLLGMFRLTMSLTSGGETTITVSDGGAVTNAVGAGFGAGVGGGISPVFAPSVRHWEAEIVAWADGFGIDPNLAATIMQIESCGDPQAISSAGAQGLFQVMPFHFTAGENMLDPATNARRGLNYLVERLAQTNGDVVRAMAGYNGGHGAAATSRDNWPAETQRYVTWGSGIYEEVQSGATVSPTLERWLAAGGASLCRQAVVRLGI